MSKELKRYYCRVPQAGAPFLALAKSGFLVLVPILTRNSKCLRGCLSMISWLPERSNACPACPEPVEGSFPKGPATRSKLVPSSNLFTILLICANVSCDPRTSSRISRCATCLFLRQPCSAISAPQPSILGRAKCVSIAPLFSYSYKLLFPQPLSFDILTNCRGVYPPRRQEIRTNFS